MAAFPGRVTRPAAQPTANAPSVSHGWETREQRLERGDVEERLVDVENEDALSCSRWHLTLGAPAQTTTTILPFA